MNDWVVFFHPPTDAVLKLVQQIPELKKLTLNSTQITASLAASDKAGVIAELMAMLVEQGLVTDGEAAIKAVTDREAIMSTGMQDGVAIPHARTDATAKLVCAVGIKPEGIDFESLDGQPSRIFVLTLSPQSSAAPHMQFMATVANCLDKSGREAILLCRTKADMYAVFTGDLSILQTGRKLITPQATDIIAPSPERSS